MKTQSSLKNFLLLALLLPGVMGGYGCQKLKKLLTKPPPAGVTQESVVIRMSGYEQTVTVRTTPAVLLAYLSDPRNWFSMSGLQTSNKPAAAAASQPAGQVGASFPLKMKKMGLEVSGNMILLRSTEEDLWLVWDNPKMFHLQRWKLKPIKEGTRLTLTMQTEVRDDLVSQVAAGMGIVEVVNKEIDRLMAGIQAHFDPSLNPADLVAKGLRGESYEGMFQSYTAQVGVDASPQAIAKWVSDVKNYGEVFGDLKFSEPITRSYQDMAVGEVVAAPAHFQMGPFKFKIDTFMVKTERKNGSVARLYMVAYGNIALADMVITPDRGGSLIKARMFTEVPSDPSAETMDLFLFGTRIPQVLADKVLAIKKGVEGAGSS